jgi:uncharacterized protein YaiI (UPF0178 family)
MTTSLYIDADACPVKEETYKVAKRYSLRVLVVAKDAMRVPAETSIELVVRSGFGEVDDWIAEQAGVGDIVVTADIPLAARCLEKSARVLDPRGEPFTDNDIGSMLAMRELMTELRQTGEVSGGPPPMAAKNRSKFLSTLDQMAGAVHRAYPLAK